MSEELSCSKVMEERPWEIRDLLYGAVQAQIADNLEDQQTGTKHAYEALSTLLNSLQSNLMPPGSSATDADGSD